jgi:hypothetical protein
MATSDNWLLALSTVKAVFESVKSGMDFATALKKYHDDPATIRESQRVSRIFSTFSDDEVASITRRLEECRTRFTAEGSGKQRATCFCSVLRDVKDANGGIPLIDDWPNMFRQLCGRR